MQTSFLSDRQLPGWGSGLRKLPTTAKGLPGTETNGKPAIYDAVEGEVGQAQ